jgi:hypothetical protein
MENLLCGVIMEDEVSFSFWCYVPVYVLVLQKNHRILSILRRAAPGLPTVVPRPRGPPLLAPANVPSACVSSAAVQRHVSADAGPVIARFPAAAAGASCVVPGVLQRCWSGVTSVSLFPEPAGASAAGGKRCDRVRRPFRGRVAKFWDVGSKPVRV